MDKISSEYSRALVEVDAVLSCLQEEEFNKIPEDMIESIKKYEDHSYDFRFDEDLDYTEWNLSKKAKAILYVIFKDYLATEEQRKILEKQDRLKFIQEEEEKKKKFDYKDLFPKRNRGNNKDNKDISIKSEKWYFKIYNKIKNIIKSK